MTKFANAKGIELVSIINIYAQQAHQIGLPLFNHLGEPTPEHQEFLETLKIATDKIEKSVQELKSILSY
jgi:predicted amidohydrolase